MFGFTAVSDVTQDVPHSRPLTVLVSDQALNLPEVADLHAGGHKLMVLGDDPVGMSLAEVAMPESAQLWINLRRSSELCRLRTLIEEEGACDRLILASQQGGLGHGLTLMQTVLAVLPIMRKQRTGEILIVLPEGDAYAAVSAFLAEVGPVLRAGGIKASLRAPAGPAHPLLS